MVNLEDILARLSRSLVGCRVAAVGSMDGLLVERHPAVGEGPAAQQAPGAAELDHVAADITSGLSLLAGEVSAQLGSRIDELIALGENGGYLARRVDDDLFCFVMVNATADLGSVRREVEAACRALRGALA